MPGVGLATQDRGMGSDKKEVPGNKNIVILGLLVTLEIAYQGTWQPMPCMYHDQLSSG